MQLEIILNYKACQTCLCYYTVGQCESNLKEKTFSNFLQGSKRPHTGVAESFGQMGTIKNASMQDVYKSDFGSFDVGNSAITGVANEQIGSHLDWDDDDRGMGINIQALLSEFGDFDDFFENDALPFGEVILLYWVSYMICRYMFSFYF